MMIFGRLFCNKVNLKTYSSFAHNYCSSAPNPKIDWRQKCVYPWFLPVQTRWLDNDQYGHVNNAVYHAMFDSVINLYFIRYSGLRPGSPGGPRGYMVTNSCTFFGSATYPNVYMAGFSIEKVGNSSVTYRLGLFPLKDQESCLPMDLVRGHFTSDPVVDTVDEHALVTGHSVHVIVDPDTGKSMTIPPDMREKLSQLKPLQ